MVEIMLLIELDQAPVPPQADTAVPHAQPGETALLHQAGHQCRAALRRFSPQGFLHLGLRLLERQQKLPAGGCIRIWSKPVFQRRRQGLTHRSAVDQSPHPIRHRGQHAGRALSGDRERVLLLVPGPCLVESRILRNPTCREVSRRRTGLPAE